MTYLSEHFSIRAWHKNFSGNLRRLRDDKRGGVLVYTALLMPVLLGFAGLAVDGGTWYALRRSAQSAADAGAIAGAFEIIRSKGASVNIAAVDSVAIHGFTTTDGDTINVSWPPTSGPNKNDLDAVEVVVSRPSPLMFSSLFLSDKFDINARAVAKVATIMEGCMIALSESSRASFKTHGIGNVTLDCTVYSNSDDPDSIIQVGSSCINAGAVYAVGGVTGTCVNPSPVVHARGIADPLADVPEPTYAGCDVPGKTTVKKGATLTLDPGTYCGNFSIHGELILNPGTYYIRDSSVSINAGANVSGDGVTFFFNDSGSSNDNIQINGQAVVNLSAPQDPDDPYNGILIYQQRGATGSTHTFNGGADIQMNGAIYTPGAHVKFNGGSDVTVWNVIVIADTIDVGGNSTVSGYDFKGGATLTILSYATLVE
ncbi:MAG: pilus assembly protein TadG-related protein [Alphaproteobacteria bacterium]|nr:pilus assembly protein TadG-related protein [Alphaproteobacteria bacterium]